MDKTRILKGSQGYGYKYTDLSQINELLESENISYYQYIQRIEGDDYIYTVPIVDGKEGEPRQGVKVVGATLQGIKNPAQEQGSAVTYARRYSLLMAFGLATTDDDAAMRISPDIVNGIKKAINELEIDKKEFCKHFGVKNIDELLLSQMQAVNNALDKKRAAKNKDAETVETVNINDLTGAKNEK